MGRFQNKNLPGFSPRWSRTLAWLLPALLLLALSFYDFELTRALRSFEGMAWISWMDQSLFEGDDFGAGDLAILVYSGIFLSWMILLVSAFLKHKRKKRSLTTNLLNLNVPALSVERWLFRVLAAGMVVVLLTHGTKALMGRSRPKDVFSGACAFRPWYDPIDEPSCIRRPHGGSFPSGHTSNAASLIFPAAALLFARRHHSKDSLRAAGICVVVFCFATVMGISRVMHGDHWVTDVWGSICINFYLFLFLLRSWSKNPGVLSHS